MVRVERGVQEISVLDVGIVPNLMESLFALAVANQLRNFELQILLLRLLVNVLDAKVQ